MLKIENGRPMFWQWDTGQRLIVEDADCAEVHFYRKGTGILEAYRVFQENGVNYVAVPDHLLQIAAPFSAFAYVYAENGQFTKRHRAFNVTARPKPADYVYTESEALSYVTLENRMDEFEKMISPEELKKAIDDAVEELDLTGTAGATFTPNVAETADGVELSWENDQDLPNPEPVTIRHGKNGAAGKSAYAYAKAGGYTGTAEEFAAKMAAEMPTKLPNPEALTVNGQSYDGSKPVNLRIEGGAGGGAQPDMAAAEGEPGHILNRTHWASIERVDLLPAGSFTLGEYADCGLMLSRPLIVGNKYVVAINGVEYERTAVFDEGWACPCIGSIHVFNEGTPADENDDVFCIADFGQDGDAALCLTSEHAYQTATIAVQECMKIVHKLPAEYLPDNILGDSQPDWNAVKSNLGHVRHRTHYSEPVVTLADNAEVTSGLCSWINYNAVKDHDEATVTYDGVSYVCPIMFRTSIIDNLDESYFYIGNFQDSAPEYPFYIYGYFVNDTAVVNVGDGTHTLSVALNEVAKKLDEKYLPASVAGVIVRSSSPGSAKKFKITVDDTGTLKVEEVTT